MQLNHVFIVSGTVLLPQFIQHISLQCCQYLHLPSLLCSQYTGLFKICATIASNMTNLQYTTLSIVTPYKKFTDCYDLDKLYEGAGYLENRGASVSFQLVIPGNGSHIPNTEVIYFFSKWSGISSLAICQGFGRSFVSETFTCNSSDSYNHNTVLISSS